jgi:hypothetical protein
MNPETPQEKIIGSTTKTGESKIPVLGIAARLTESVKEAQQAEKALERANSTESFMQGIREQAATENHQQNGERPAIRQ